jgi:hypothetical protein
MTMFTASLLAGAWAGFPRIWAYLDPGTGSMLFQVLIAGLLSALFCAKSSLLSLRNALFKHHDK